MRRQLEIELIRWKDQSNRLPLLIRGARQVGKSYLVEQLGKNHFSSMVTLNFELQPSLKSCFESLDPARIIPAIEVFTRCSIEPGKCLLFLDEIQECPEAIRSLRYFKEKMPELHIIGAGSLLEFTLQEEKFSFPVGRVQFIFLKPLSFHEFLEALGETKVLATLSGVTFREPLSTAMHEHFLALFRRYLLVGGMPAAVSAYLEQNQSFLAAQRVHQSLLQTYQSDFGKYSSRSQYKYLQQFFEKAPMVVGSHFKYVAINPEVRSRELKTALQQLNWAGLIHTVYQTQASGVPLHAQVRIDDSKFKLLFLDVGLMQTAGKIDSAAVWDDDILQIRSGALAEQVVGQELIAYQDPYESPQLFFWKREKKNSSAEVDYVIQNRTAIIPVEVKAGKTGHLKSLARFCEEKKPPVGLKISAAPLSRDPWVLSLPFYLIEQIPRLLSEAVSTPANQV